MAQSPPGKPFHNILNFRDIGRFVNARSRDVKLKEGLFFRSARPDEASPSDRTTLLTQHALKTIIDLRTKSEHIAAAQKRSSHISSAPAASPSNAHAASPLQIPGLTYQNINLNGPAYSFALIRQLPSTSTLRLAALMAFGYRNQAISILGRQVMAQRGLSGLAIDTLTHSVSEIRAVFSMLGNREAWPVLVHCTQGKDRTGLVVLLVLLLLGVGEEVIEQDYMRSQDELGPERAEKLKEVRAFGMPDSFVDCDPEWTGKVVECIGEKGGVERYLDGIGVGRDVRERVREILLEKG